MLAQLRLAATRHACFEPFVAWWTLVRRAQRDTQRAGKEEAEHAQRRRRLATDRHEEQAARVARLDRSLRRFGARSQLAARFGAPPFSVLDARKGYWKERRAFWERSYQIHSERGRHDNLLGYKGLGGEASKGLLSGGVAIPGGATAAPRLRLAASGARPKAWAQGPGPMGPGPMS